ncbi:MAG: hypothetical protein MJ025_01445 [Victivallaceae bacterium]|nr:hypothetical protein [Victivallaceae bacterium]
MFKKFILLLFMLSCLVALSEVIVVKPDAYKNLNGWEVQQTVLLSTGKGNKASTTINAAESGKYYMYVSSINHEQDPARAWRQTHIIINGTDLGRFCDAFGRGQKKPGLGWTTGRKVTLKKGANELSLSSHAGNCRLGDIIFSTEKIDPVAQAQKAENAPVDYSKLTGDLPNIPKLDGIFGRPKGNPNGPKLLVLSGSRPWIGNGLGSAFGRAGASVSLLNSVYLGGLGGASIKITPTDPVEPKPVDYVTPEFKQLSRYKAVIINDINASNQDKLFTEDRVEAMKQYVANGGVLVLTINAPESLGDLLPVELGDMVDLDNDDPVYAVRPVSAKFSRLPERWQIVDPYKEATLTKDAKTVSAIVDEKGKENGIYIACKKYGKGSVWFMNTQRTRRQTAVQMFNWCYCGVLFVSTVNEAAGLNLDVEKSLTTKAEPLKPKTIASAEAEIRVPKLDLSKDDAKVEVNGNEARFSSGYRFVSNGKSLDITYPDGNTYVRNLRPVFKLPKGAAAVDDASTAEATNAKDNTILSKEQFAIKSMKGGSNLTIELVGDKGSAIEWQFVTGKADVDGRQFAGIGEKFSIRKLGDYAKLLYSVGPRYEIDADNVNIRRFACYQPPRGYNDYDATGKADVDTRPWGFFSDGQPFTWVEGKKAVFSEFIDDLFPIKVQMRMKKGQKTVSSLIDLTFGRVKAPQETAIIWHMAGPASANTTNDWMAMYQFQRHNLRKKFGVPEKCPQTYAAFSDTCNANERLAAIEDAAEFGFRIMHVPMCPSPMHAFGHMKIAETIRENGMGAYPWMPCAHDPDKTPTVKAHPDWFLKDEKGNLTQFFNHFYVADMYNPDFRKWFMGKVDEMIDSGVVTCWYDMGGAASGMMDFKKEESKVGLWAQMEIFRHWYERGGWATTEGMNPIVNDGYLFFADRYKGPFIGREFQLFGVQCQTSVKDHLYFDYFRTSMYCTFFPIVMNNWRQKFESIEGENRMVARIKHYLPAINAALDNGMPFIRETPFGTTWSSDKGGAIFCFDGVNDIDIKIPDGYYAESMTTAKDNLKKLNGVLPKKVDPETIIIIRKK